MNAITIAELREKARELYCPNAMALAEPQLCLGKECHAWSETKRRVAKDVWQYVGWCAICGQTEKLEERND